MTPAYGARGRKLTPKTGMVLDPRRSAQAAFFSPGAQRAVPRQAGYSGRASSSGTPASPGGGGGGAYHRQPHVMGMGGISAAAAPYIAHSPGTITPGTGTAASSVRSGFSPVRSPYDLLLHGGLTTGPAAVLLPMGPGSDAGRGAGSIVMPGGAARAAWSTASSAGGSSVGVGRRGGGTSTARAGGARGTEAMGTEFFRRNNLLQRKRQQWAAQGQRVSHGLLAPAVALERTKCFGLVQEYGTLSGLVPN